MTDVVIAWVDGDDPAHKRKKSQYLTGKNETAHDDIAGAMRYRSTGEIFYCIASIIRYAPWVHRIFIVTDNQNPNVDDFVKRNFPDNNIPIEIVDHKILFRGYEEYLPTFNSLAISTMLWRIPGLSDSFLYFNDDVFLAAPAKENDWFHEDETNIYAVRFPAIWARFIRWCKHVGKKHKTFGHKDPMLNATDILKSNFFFLFPHAPVPMRRTWYENFYAENPELLHHNIRHRFREPSQFSSPTLFYLSVYANGKLHCLPSKGTTCFFKPSIEKDGYMKRKIKEADSNKKIRFGCINSLGETTVEEQELFKEWICRKLDISL